MFFKKGKKWWSGIKLSTWPPEASKAPNSKTLLRSKLIQWMDREQWEDTTRNTSRHWHWSSAQLTYSFVLKDYTKNTKIDKIKKMTYNLLKGTPDKTLDWKAGHDSTSSKTHVTPTSEIFVSTVVNMSEKDACLTFWAMAPIAWADATLVSQFLLRRHWATWCHKKTKSKKG